MLTRVPTECGQCYPTRSRSFYIYIYIYIYLSERSRLFDELLRFLFSFFFFKTLARRSFSLSLRTIPLSFHFSLSRKYHNAHLYRTHKYRLVLVRIRGKYACIPETCVHERVNEREKTSLSIE